MALQPQDHGVSIFRHRSTNRPTASLAAEVAAATPKPMTPPGQAVKAAAASLQPRQLGRVGGLPQKAPVQRIGYFGPRGGGIKNLPTPGPLER